MAPHHVRVPVRRPDDQPRRIKLCHALHERRALDGRENQRPVPHRHRRRRLAHHRLAGRPHADGQAAPAALSRLNPLAGLKKFASIRTLARAGSNMAKVLIVIIVAVSVIGRHVQDILTLSQLEAPQAVIKAAELVLELAFWLLVALLILGFIDYVYQRWQWERDNRMSKQAIKEEMRNMIGDPTARKRQRDFALSILRQRMGQAVPSADVIVTNPEHLAIALKWDPETMNAPKVVAKGADYLAIRIRQLAMANGVPIVERKPLARAMYPLVRVGDEIPPRFYQAIAELLAYVYRLNGKMAG
ncbi:MAG: EscU/YscU/HrcU family type III secretion system export apparatus switch protein [Planctomycetes bacterium]|nr:EscU/YscU/HrcU family type III secretion system export apparatus switch protein [Planctomycetota bacterium]